jgi:DNA-directed RNA polymerase subunit H (RpoH/RPB5)
MIEQPSNIMESWKSERVDESIKFLLERRSGSWSDYAITELAITDDNPKAIVIKVSNQILVESTKGPKFIVIPLVNQHSHSNLLHELLDAIQPQNYCKVFFIDELVANPMANKMVPRHELCTQDMIDDLLREHSITTNMLPKIFLRDPIVRWNAWKIGDVIKITRPNGEIYYRIVVDKV